MKKQISLLLAILMLLSLCANAFAEETGELIFTPDIVMDRLEKGDDSARTAEDQTVNGWVPQPRFAPRMKTARSSMRILNGFTMVTSRISAISKSSRSAPCRLLIFWSSLRSRKIPK